MAPLNLLADIAGPMTRTLEDAVAVLQVIAGPDPDDPVTIAGSDVARAFSPGGHPAAIPNYLAALKVDGLKGRRIGVLRQAYERDSTDPEIVNVFMTALDDMKRAGAIIVDPVRVDLDNVRRAEGAGTCGGSLRAIRAAIVVTITAVITISSRSIALTYFMFIVTRVVPCIVTEIAWRFSPNCG